MSELYHSGRPYRLWSKEAQARHRARFGHAPDEADRKKWRERDSHIGEQRRRNAGKKRADSVWSKTPQNRPYRSQPQERVYDSSKIKKNPENPYGKPEAKNPPKPGSTKHNKEAIVKKAVTKTKEEMRKKR